METRVTRLETEFEHVRSDLDEIKADLKGVRETLDSLAMNLGTLGERLTEKPGKGFVIGTVIAIFALCAGMVGATVAGMQYLQGAL